MTFREEIQKRLTKKRAEVTEIEGRIRKLKEDLESAKSYVLGMEDTLKLIPMEIDEGVSSQGSVKPLRVGTAVAKAREAILQNGKPMHINALLTAMGKVDDSNNRVSLAGSLGAYVREKKIFTRTAPNVFGLFEIGDPAESEEEIKRGNNLGLVA